MRTWLSERFGLDVPVVCAPMAGAAGGELAAAVCRAGGLGMIGAGAVTPEWISEQCRIAGSAGRPFGVGLLAWLLADNPGQLDAVLAARPALVSVSYGPYQRYLPALHEAGATISAFDPEGTAEAEKLMPELNYCIDPYEAMDSADALILITEWTEFRALDLGRVKRLLRRPLVIDLRNIYKPEEMAAIGLAYHSIGRASTSVSAPATPNLRVIG